METDERMEIVQRLQGGFWEDRLEEIHRKGRLCAWMSSLHHDVPYRLDSNKRFYGSNLMAERHGCSDSFKLRQFPAPARL